MQKALVFFPQITYIGELVNLVIVLVTISGYRGISTSSLTLGNAV